MTEEMKNNANSARSSFDVIKSICKKQRVYGVEEGKFARYAEYCNKRAKKVRRSMDIKQWPFPNFTPDVYHNPQHIEMLVWIAENAFARYRDCKKPPVTGPGRRHALRRLRKSIKWWKEVEECARIFGTEGTLKQIEIYNRQAQAMLDLELGRWKEAKEGFLGVISSLNDIDQAENDDLLSSYIKGIINDIQPLLVFCRYNLSEPDVEMNPEIKDKARSVTTLSGATSVVKNVAELEWKGRKIPITNETLRAKVATVLDLINDTNSKEIYDEFRLTLFDRLIAESHSTRNYLRSTAMDDAELKGLLDHFLRWNYFFATLERSRFVISTLGTVEEKAEFSGRTYKRILDSKGEFEGENAIDALENSWRAVRCFYTAQSHQLKPVERQAMYNRSVSLASKALNIIENEKSINLSSLVEWLNSLIVTSKRRRIELIAGAEDIASETSQRGENFLNVDSSSYTSCSNVVPIPPNPKLVTPKPVFFDVSTDFLQYPDLDKQQVKKKGFFGFW